MPKTILLFLILIFSLGIRLYRLDILPGEWYGDISNVHEYVVEILKGNRPFYFFQSAGPVYHYLVAPLVLIFRHEGYEAYKYSSVAVSLLTLGAIYLFIKEAFNRRIAVIALLISGLSLWLLIWSRLGNLQIIIPGEVALSSYFLFRYIKKRHTKYLILSLSAASLGWYTYPSAFILPVFIYFFLMLYHFVRLNFFKALRQFALSTLVLSIGLIPMICIIRNQTTGMTGNFGANGYVGSKVLPVLKMKKGEFISKLSINMAKTLLMFNVRGDNSFRVNVSKAPQLDRISGMLFLIGLVSLIRSHRRVVMIFILLSFFVLPLPSLSPAIPDIEIPNNSRTIGIIPSVYLLVALGLWQVFLVFKKLAGRKFAAVSGAILLSLTVYLNLDNYFMTYARGLPENNLGPSRYIAEYIDREIDPMVKLYFGECCWGDWGQPEPKGIAYSLKKDRPVDYSRLIKGCSDLDYFPAAIVMRHEDKFKNEYTDCISRVKQIKITTPDGIFISNLYLLDKKGLLYSRSK